MKYTLQDGTTVEGTPAEIVELRNIEKTKQSSAAKAPSTPKKTKAKKSKEEGAQVDKTIRRALKYASGLSVMKPAGTVYCEANDLARCSAEARSLLIQKASLHPEVELIRRGKWAYLISKKSFNNTNGNSQQADDEDENEWFNRSQL